MELSISITDEERDNAVVDYVFKKIGLDKNDYVINKEMITIGRVEAKLKTDNESEEHE